MKLLQRLPLASIAYHGVGPIASDDVDPNRLLLDPALFREQVRWLVDRGYRFRSLDELLAGYEPGPGDAVLTFDDGFRNTLTIAAPILADLGVPASAFVCPGWWGGQHPDVRGPQGELVAVEDLTSLRDGGVAVGSHSLTHRDLRRLEDDDLERELVGSRRAIEALTQEPCRALAYPFGFHDERVRDAAVAAGYELAFAWAPGPWHRMRAPRLPNPPRHGARRLALKLRGLRRWWG